MKPFSTSDAAKTLVGVYLPPETLRATLWSLRYEEKLGLLRLWGSEGIPFAFQNAPLLWESIRHWLGLQLSIHPKLITMIGSARLGYSLSPSPEFGRPLSGKSDLDLSIVAEAVFDRLRQDFDKWKADMLGGLIQPRTSKQQELWPAILEELPVSILRGFIDPQKIPTLKRYAAAQHVLQTMWLLGQKISITPGTPTFSRVSVRVYRDWRAFLNLLLHNLDRTILSLPAPKQIQ